MMSMTAGNLGNQTLRINRIWVVIHPDLDSNIEDICLDRSILDLEGMIKDDFSFEGLDPAIFINEDVAKIEAQRRLAARDVAYSMMCSDTDFADAADVIVHNKNGDIIFRKEINGG